MKEILNKFKAELENIGIKYIKSEDEWRPETTYNKECLEFFEDYINWEILKYFLKHDGHIFSMVKKCKWCHLYFLYSRKDKKLNTLQVLLMVFFEIYGRLTLGCVCNNI